MADSFRYLAYNLKANALPELYRDLVRFDYEVELHCRKAELLRLNEGEFRHQPSDPSSICFGRDHITSVANVRTESRLIRLQPERAHDLAVRICDVVVLFRRKPKRCQFALRRVRIECVSVAARDNGFDDPQNGGLISFG